MKTLNQQETISRILAWGSESIGHSIDVPKFNQKVSSEGDNFLLEVCTFCEIEPVYN